MKLKEYLESLDSNATIKVGSKDGSAYFYVGNPSDMLAEMDKYNDMLIKSADRQIKLAQNELDYLLSGIVTDVKLSGLRIDGAHFKAVLEYCLTDETLKNAIRSKSKLENYKRHRSAMGYLGEREVEEARPADSAADEGVQIILVAGYENGRYWCTDDAKRDKSGNLIPDLRTSNMEKS